MATYVLDHVALEMGREPASLTPNEVAQLELWQADAEAEVLARIPDVDRTSPAYLRVIRLAVARRATAPKRGVVQTSTSVDDARVDTRYRESPDDAASMILPEWWAMLGWSDSGEAFTIFPGQPPRPTLPWWL